MSLNLMVFDQFSRYKACSDLIRRTGFVTGSSVLDIGSGPECLFGQFMPDSQVTYVDPLIPGGSGEGHITGDIFSTELDGKSFDVVSAVDVLEHVPPEWRQAFLERMSLLGKNTIILGFPCSDLSDAFETDRTIDDQYRRIFGHDYPWLEEHYRYGLPSVGETVAQLTQLGWHCQSVGHGHAPWLRELLGFAICVWDIPSLNKVVLEISEKFNRELYSYDFRAPYYRQFVIASRNPLLPVSAPKTANDYIEADRFFQTLMEEARNSYFTESLRHFVELNAQIDVLNQKIEEVSSWITSQYEETASLQQAFFEKQSELMKMSDWAQSLVQELNRRSTFFMYRAEIKVKRYLVFGKKKLAQSIVGGIARYIRDRRRNSERRVSLDVLKRSVMDKDGRLIVTFPIITWDFRRQRPQHIVSRLRDSGFSIVYVAMSLAPLGRRLRGNKDALTQIAFNELSPHVNQAWLNSFKQLNVYTDPIEGDDLWNVSSGLDALIAELRPKSIIYLVQFPGWGLVAQDLRNKLGGKIIFDCMDDHAGFSTNSGQALKTEEMLIENADLVITSSNLLEERVKLINSNTIQVKNGTEFEHFANPIQNGQLDHLHNRPIIGYYGAISDWFDMELVAYCASQRPDWNFVLIGATFGADLRPVEGLRNVHLLGEKPYANLPGYLAYFDVCTIPFKLIPLTLATNPVKFYEYLSAGKPVVSVDLPELHAYREDCYLARNRGEFLAQLERANAERQEEKLIARRLKLASENSWDARVSTILEMNILKTSLLQTKTL